MKIDLHTHTRKCKAGDADTRNVSAERFCEAVLSTDVRIVAITNHNVFDLAQFEEIEVSMQGEAQVWPGVELDVVEDNVRGHLLVIVSPKVSKQFDELVRGLTTGSTPDTFTASIDKIVQTFGELEPLYVAHYKQKTPNLSDATLTKLSASITNPHCVIKEVTNSISAGIYISHGHASIYGSDGHDWSKYEELARDLPDLRLPVESFEHFCLLLKKDPTTINTALDKKTPEVLTLTPFEDKREISLKFYNDINVIFGPKGTGKSRILRAIAKHYSSAGVDARVYESSNVNLNEMFDLKGKEFSIDLNGHGVNYCTNEIRDLRNAEEVPVTAMSKYVAHFAGKLTNTIAKRLRIKDMHPEEMSKSKRDFSQFHDAETTTQAFLRFIDANPAVKKELETQEYDDLLRILSNFHIRLRRRKKALFIAWKAIALLNMSIARIRMEIERKTGAPAKPTTTGFLAYSRNRLLIERCVAEIQKNMRMQIPIHGQEVGDLGPEKGQLHCTTVLIFQTGQVTDGAAQSVSNAKKTTQKEFANSIRKISESIYTSLLFERISELNEIEDVEQIKTMNELLLFKRYFSINGVKYEPSTGEASMVMLHKELGTEKDIYILDEPEKSLGNDYISDVIVPLLKQRARSGKKIFIATHDANIAVRTLPYSSIYRRHGNVGYETFSGNPFSNHLVQVGDQENTLDWKKVSMRTLEGGEEAFGERGQIYGNS